VKLSPQDVADIRTNCTWGRHAFFAAKYGVCAVTISRIVRGKSHKPQALSFIPEDKRQAILRYRDERGISLSAMARDIDLKRDKVYKVVMGITKTTPETKEKIYRHCGIKG
jgi:ribosome-binding protein aMBF1 (putative translation factor)